MNKKYPSLFWVKEIFISSGVALAMFLLFLGASAVYALDSNTQPAKNGLKGGTFIYWLNEVLVDPPKTVTDTITNPVVHQALRLADTNGDVVATGANARLGINTTAPVALLDVSGNDASIKLLSPYTEPHFSFKNSFTQSDIWFRPSNNNLVFTVNKRDVININPNGNTSVSPRLSSGGVSVVKAGQVCPSGLYAYAFDNDGNIVCQ